MDIKRGYQLKHWQSDDPIVWSVRTELTMPERAFEGMLLDVFGQGRAKRLQTWQRCATYPDGPHWIGVRSGTPLHTDPRYPRYTHQLVVRNDGWVLNGMGTKRHLVGTGTLLCLDTHSPHQLTKSQDNRGLFYLAASMDAGVELDASLVHQELERFIADRALDR